MMQAAVKAFVRKDELKDGDTEKFKMQFSLNDAKMKLLKEELQRSGSKEFGEQYKISVEDMEEMKRKFKTIGEDEINQYMAGLRDHLADKDHITIDDLDLSLEEHDAMYGRFENLGRRVFMDKYRLKEENIKELDKLIQKFTEETISFSEAKSQIVVFMSHGKQGMIMGIPVFF